MIYLKTEGLILAQRPKGEADAIVHILTKKFGLLNLIARSLRKANSRLIGLCQTGNAAKIFLGTSNYQQYQLISLLGYKFPGQGFKRYPYLYLWALRFLKSWNWFEISEPFWQTLVKLDQQLNHQPRGFQIWFSLQVLKELGAEPNFQFCHNCGRPLLEAFCHGSRLVCRNCKRPSYNQLSQAELNQLKRLVNSPQPVYPYPTALKSILAHHLKVVRQTG
ncbi:MAG: recombination protein O N-terminal domain-containing protein [Candidatus Bathyarchaeia archaeon]